MRFDDLRQHGRDLGFTPQPQVRWLSPPQLARTAVKVVLSTLFADYSDRREVQAALPARSIKVSPRPEGDLWIDLVADLGDGFDPTYTVAHLIGREELEVDGLRLPRADVLVMGGDEVYPTPSGIAYEDRLTGPYRAALPGPPQPVDRRDRQPLLLALPGNHDWYDGLTSFLRVFTQRRPIGGWRLEQSRSYFVVQLSERWWLVGLDTQLGDYIDWPQIRYFREHLSQYLRPGHAVIVCAPTPTWVHTGLGDPDAFNSLHWFEREVVRVHVGDDGSRRDTGARVRLWLSGDYHHYARYTEDGGEHRELITCGLGGAYLSDTHELPAELTLPPKESRLSQRLAPATFRRVSEWPEKAVSRAWALRAFGLGPGGIVGRNPGLWTGLGLVHALLLPMLAFFVGLGQREVFEMVSPAHVLHSGGLDDLVPFLGQVAGWAAVVVAGTVLLPALRAAPGRRTLALAAPPDWLSAVGLQLVVALTLLGGLLAVPWPDAWRDWVVLLLSCLIAFGPGGWLACYAVALYLPFSRNRTVRGYMFSAQSIEEGKGFLRMHLDRDESLTVHPILVETVCHDWTLEDAPVGPPTTGPIPTGSVPTGSVPTGSVPTGSGSGGGGVTRKRPVPAAPFGPIRLLEKPIRIEP